MATDAVPVAPRASGAARRALVMAIVVAAGFALSARPSCAQAPVAERPALPESRLAVRVGSAWRDFWRSGAAPARWTSTDPTVQRAVRWTAAAPGMSWGTLALAGTGEAWRLRVVLVRVDPARFALALAEGADRSLFDGRWTVDSAPPAARVALNAGQFRYGTPWGWVVLDGHELLPARRGPLAMTIAQDSAGRVHWIEDADLERVAAMLHPRVAFQSYPALLVGDGEVPTPLRVPGMGLDVAHRDARLALGELRDGTLLVALTRFDALGGHLGEVPFGPTVPEMAAIMGALGCRRALLLDGGTSAQLLLRDAAGQVRRWRGLRGVPLGLVMVPR